MSEIEEEFTSIRDQVCSKLEQACQLLSEAEELSKKECYWMVTELNICTLNLTELIQNAFDREPSGWDTSGCFY